jgi:hypothetical protein
MQCNISVDMGPEREFSELYGENMKKFSASFP